VALLPRNCSSSSPGATSRFATSKRCFGLAWAVAQPLATMAVFTLFLGRAAGVSEGIEHYSLFVFAGDGGVGRSSATRFSTAALSVVTK